MNKILSLFILLMIAWACQDITVGYLEVGNASYNPDSLEVRISLDSTGVDAQRVKTGQPWMSYKIEGVEGTQPIFLSIRNISSSDGDVNSMWKYLTIRNDGTFMIPLNHEIVAGRYQVSLGFKNEGYEKFKDDLFVIIVK